MNSLHLDPSPHHVPLSSITLAVMIGLTATYQSSFFHRSEISEHSGFVHSEFAVALLSRCRRSVFICREGVRQEMSGVDRRLDS